MHWSVCVCVKCGHACVLPKYVRSHHNVRNDESLLKKEKLWSQTALTMTFDGVLR